MRFRFSGSPTLLALAAAMAGLSACSGGGKSSNISISTACTGSAVNALCLDSCSLGCRGNTCEVTDIAQNENIVLIFSQPIDPLWANSSTIQFRTATGAVPVGDFLVNGNVIEFVPRVLTVQSQSFFGFQAGETYTMTLPGGVNEVNALRSTSGDPLDRTVTCTLRVTRGIIDLNGVPPRAELVLPTSTSDAPLDTLIALRFNELIDATPFVNAQGTNTPVVYSVARTIQAGNQRICNPETTPLVGSLRLDLIPSAPAAVVTFTPFSPLPGNSCVRISVTSEVRDLSGRSAEPQIFEFQTIETALTEQSVIEEFDTDDQLDLDQSAGTWSAGKGTFAQIGGDGRHGEFSLGLGNQVPGTTSPRVFVIDTDNTTVPGSSTLSGIPITVTDGQFFFSRMVVPADVRLVFTGNSPPRITVRGRLQIDGQIDLRGESLPYHDVTNITLLPGQPGGAGGVFGGSGGKGGDRCSGSGATPNNSGVNGQSCRVLAGHAFAGQVGSTGGRGSTVFPASGLRTDVIFPPPDSQNPFGGGHPDNVVQYAQQHTAGGGGGGLLNAGGDGTAVSNQGALDHSGQTRPEFRGPPAVGGTAVGANLLTVPAGVKSSLHLTVGGSGGGGAGSHPALLIQTLVESTSGRWSPGGGGGGGGGAIALRAGDDLRLSSGAAVLVSGGSCGDSPATQTAIGSAAPGGGGSGGSIVLQSGRTAQLLGTLDVRGGRGGVLSRASNSVTLNSPPPHGGLVVSRGGDGSVGVLRLEMPTAPPPTSLPNALPAAGPQNVGPLLETDTRTGFQSLFYSTGQPFGPEFLRYEIRATINGTPFVFSDDSTIGTPARPGFGPLEAYWQGVRMDISTGAIDLDDLANRPWRLGVGGPGNTLASDGRNAFRFLLVIDRTNGDVIEIDSVKVIYRV